MRRLILLSLHKDGLLGPLRHRVEAAGGRSRDRDIATQVYGLELSCAHTPTRSLSDVEFGGPALTQNGPLLFRRLISARVAYAPFNDT
jgi:hypothetical protein